MDKMHTKNTCQALSPEDNLKGMVDDALAFLFFFIYI